MHIVMTLLTLFCALTYFVSFIIFAIKGPDYLEGLEVIGGFFLVMISPIVWLIVGPIYGFKILKRLMS
jgi:hypothetical protein